MKNSRARASAVLREVVTPIVPISWLVVTIVVALAGPFGTFATLDLAFRFVYWGAMVATTIGLVVGLRVFWRLAVNSQVGWVEDILVVGSLGLIVGQVVELVNGYLWPGEDLVSAFFVSMLAFLISGSCCAIRRVLQNQHLVAEPTFTQNTRDRLLDRLDLPETARLQRISSDNHHIRIVTSDGGEHRILMRLRDAVAEIDVEPGMCVHRSHWVAEAAISRVVESGGREAVELPCGNTLPIGPKYRSNLVDAGMINA